MSAATQENKIDTKRPGNLENPLLGNDHDISKYTTAVAKQRSARSKIGMAFSDRSESRWYKQDSWRVNSSSNFTTFAKCCENKIK
jgi:hypothetical protein